MGYNPNLWGSEGWYFIHFVALNYPVNPTEQDKKNYMQFLESLQHTLPCEGCSYNFGMEMQSHPPNLNSRKEFFNWTVDMHNAVNKRNKKKELSYDDAMKQISKRKETERLKDSFILTSGIATAFFFLFRMFKK
jgi:hypothetical protein